MEDVEKLKPEQFPKALLEIPQPPSKLFIRGKLPPANYVYLTIVGSRKYTSYGRDICEKLIRSLAGYPVVIVSGLAIGMDTIVHRAALDAGLITMGFPGSGLDNSVMHPRSNIGLAQEIVDSGGCLMSELDPSWKATIYSFPRRNRLMAGISRATLVIEAAEKSGTLITARMALDYNRDVLVVPGSVFSDTSTGTNKLIKQGATPITSSKDLLEALGFEVENANDDPSERYKDASADEKIILDLLIEPMERDELVRISGMGIAKCNAVISIMEIKEFIKEELGEIRKI